MKTKEQFLQEVRDEIEYLRINTTNREKERLNPNTFNHEDVFNCIYGQLTGSCLSKRAIELYPKTYNYINDINTQGDCYTALEKYLFMVKEKDRVEVLLYIKGETDSYNKNHVLLFS